MDTPELLRPGLRNQQAPNYNYLWDVETYEGKMSVNSTRGTQDISTTRNGLNLGNKLGRSILHSIHSKLKPTMNNPYDTNILGGTGLKGLSLVCGRIQSPKPLIPSILVVKLEILHCTLYDFSPVLGIINY